MNYQSNALETIQWSLEIDLKEEELDFGGAFDGGIRFL